MTGTARAIGQRRATLAGEVRREIERLIVEGELGAGEKLNELALSAAMGISRGTVREAIRSLADSGLIDLVANRGAFVRRTTLAEVRDLYDLRGAIFAMACAGAARRVGAGEEPRLVRRLEASMERMRAAHAGGDARAYYRLNIAFHDLLMEGSGNARAKAVYDNLVREMHLFRRRGLSIVTNIAHSIEEHGAILAGVAAGEPEAARRAAEAHIRAGLARYLQRAAADGGEG
jgi:DNA-binding GntR family transcriptional regulator